MQPLITPVVTEPFPWQSDYRDKHLFIGSCFTENIGSLMEALKFDVTLNPFGILYNPVSAANCLRRLLSAESFTAGELFQHNGLWHSYSHHGRFSAPSPPEALKKINSSLIKGADALKKARFLLITLGTAWVYELKTTRQTVANCHKVPAGQFRRYRLSVTQTVSALENQFEEIWKVNPGLKIIMTVSPVRHHQEGAHANQLSKAVLLLAADDLENRFGRERCATFPAYEIMMDELRDYRFYDSDMIHPSPLAIEYIWEKFREAFFSPETISVAQKVAAIRKAMEHRPIHSSTEAFRTFLKQSAAKTKELAKSSPWLDFSAEIAYFSEQLEE